MLKDFRYLIVGGVPKAGTTSIFVYMKNHPEVCPAFLKETRFFLDRDYPIPSRYKFEDGLEKYETFFKHCSKNKKRLRVDVTPFYIYSFNTPYNIRKSLPYLKLVFILRNPISRLISVYRFNLQNGVISKNLDFDNYLELCKKIGKSDVTPKKEELPFYALAQGNYSEYLMRYFEIFDRNDILVLFYEEFFNSLREHMKLLSNFVGIDPSFYKNYNFYKYNVTKTTRFVLLHKCYLKIKNYFIFRSRFQKKNLLFLFLKKFYILFNHFYEKINFIETNVDISISYSTLSFLINYYSEEKDRLKKLLKREIPWEF